MMPTVFLVDDDTAYRNSLSFLLGSAGLDVREYASADAFLDEYRPEERGCLVLDVRMPGMSGLELQERLSELGSELPIIFITGHGDVPMSVKAMKNGAVDFLEKPFDDNVLLEHIRDAFDLNRRNLDERQARERFLKRLGRLTAREREVMALIIDGMSNKEIAARLDVSHRTVEVHRARIMDKMEVDSLADLITSTIRHDGLQAS